MVFEDDEGIGAFICLKPEAEEIELEDRTLPAVDRVKISTIKIDDRYRGRRIGEGAIGLTLWQWQKMGKNEIYVTVFEKHDGLIMKPDVTINGISMLSLGCWTTPRPTRMAA